MGDVVWRLEEIGDYIFLLNCYGPGEKNILQRRFKKDQKAFNKLYDLLGKFDELGFDDAMSFGLSNHYIGSIANNRHLSLIEIRVKSTLWRVVTYVDRGRKVLVMLDAFEHHKSKTMSTIANENEKNVKRAMELLERGGRHGDEG